MRRHTKRGNERQAREVLPPQDRPPNRLTWFERRNCLHRTVWRRFSDRRRRDERAGGNVEQDAGLHARSDSIEGAGGSGGDGGGGGGCGRGICFKSENELDGRIFDRRCYGARSSAKLQLVEHARALLTVQQRGTKARTDRRTVRSVDTATFGATAAIPLSLHTEVRARKLQRKKSFLHQRHSHALLGANGDILSNTQQHQARHPSATTGLRCSYRCS